MSDTLADMITRIRNGQKSQKKEIISIFSNLNLRVCEVLKKKVLLKILVNKVILKKIF